MQITPNGAWQEFGYKDERYVLPSGRIVGAVNGGYREYHAFANGKKVGTYATMEQAKAAVERSLTISMEGM